MMIIIIINTSIYSETYPNEHLPIAEIYYFNLIFKNNYKGQKKNALTLNITINDK